MSRLLVNNPGGWQEIIAVGDGGGYFDPTLVLWDERVDGPLPAITLGGMKRVGAELVLDSALLAGANATSLAVIKSDLSKQIDAAVLAIYDRPMALSKEYEARESAAAAFKAAGYTGPVPARLAGFATPAGLTPAAAADLVLSQAAQLRSALDSLSNLRMRKYEVNMAATEAEARAAHADIMARIAVIAKALG